MSEFVGIDAARGWRMLARRSAALFAGEGAARVVGFVIVLVLARRLGPSGFGVVTLGLTLVAWFAFVVDSGTELLNVRNVARQPARFREIAEQMLGLRLAISFAAAIVFVVGVEVVARSAFTRDTVVLFALLLPAIALNLRWMVLGVGGSRGVAAGNAASRLLVLVGVLLLVAGVHDVKLVPFLEALGELTYALIVLVFVGGRLGSMRPRMDLAVWRSTLQQSFPLMVGGVARAIIFSFDIVAISLALGPRDVGIYGVASKPVAFAAAFVGLFSLSFLSAFSATSAEHEAALHGRAWRVSVVVSCALAAALSLASFLVPTVFGEEYRDAVPVLAVIAWRMPFAALTGVYATVLVARERQLTLMWNGIVAVPAVIAIDLVAILLFGLMGAAVASIVVAALFFLIIYRSVAREDPELRVARGRRR